MLRKIKKVLIVSLGVIILAIGIHFFLVPANLAAGGLMGFAIVINGLFPFLPISAIMLVGNLVLFALGFLLIGLEFGGLTIYASLFLSGVLYVMEGIVPVTGPLVSDLWINLVYGIGLAGGGMGVVFFQNASTGGTDILAKIINKYTHLDIGKALFVVDFFITVAAGFAFGFEIGLYATFGIVINALVIDSVIAGFNKQFCVLVYTNKIDEINDYINNVIQRGTTLYYAQGGYKKEDKQIISAVVSRRQYIKIRNYAKKVDDEVFITSNTVMEVHGEGFKFYS